MSAATQVTSNVANAEAAALVAGTVVRISAANAALRAQANAPANVAGTLGVALAGANPGVSFSAVLSGDASTLMEPGLTLAPGQSVYVSATQPGRATNVAPPANATLIGTIKNTAGYAITSRVVVVVSTLGPAATAGGGVTKVTMTVQNVNPGNPVDVGQVMRVVGNQFASPAAAPNLALSLSTIGVATTAAPDGGQVDIALTGEQTFLCMTGLTIAAGDKLYLTGSGNPVNAGRVSNAPAITPIVIGTVTDASAYGLNSTVKGILEIADSETCRFIRGGLVLPDGSPITFQNWLDALPLVRRGGSLAAEPRPITILGGAFDLNGGNSAQVGGFPRSSSDNAQPVVRDLQFGPLPACVVKNLKVFASIGVFAAAKIRFNGGAGSGGPFDLTVPNGGLAQDLSNVLAFDGTAGNCLLTVFLESLAGLDAVLHWSCEVHLT